MRREAEYSDEILDRYISGYHEYALEDPVHISYAGQSLGALLGVPPKTLCSEDTDLYLPMVHPADCEMYRAFLREMAAEETTRCIEYRILNRAGEVRHVIDSMTSRRLPDGTMAGYATLTDVTRLKREGDALRFINDTVPCGLLRYTCEKAPRVTYANGKMVEMMRIGRGDSGELDVLELYKSNIYLAIAEESRARFARVLQTVFLEGKPYAGEVTVLRGDGSKGRLFGWVTKTRGRTGEEEFQSICMDITKRYQTKLSEQTETYLTALTGVYDMIFEFDRIRQTVRYLEGNVPFFGTDLKDIPMELHRAIEKWLNTAVVREDRSALLRFLLTHVQRVAKEEKEENAPQITFGMYDGAQKIRNYQGVLLRTDTERTLFCCREIAPAPETKRIRVEIRTFGYFDVFVDGHPIVFRNAKAKELLALLVDRRGGYLSSEEAIGYLWEEEPASALVLSRYRKVALRLKNLLEEYGIADIVESVSGKRRLVTELVECDLYRYLEDREGNAKLFGGSYLTNYSWAEMTLGELLSAL